MNRSNGNPPHLKGFLQFDTSRWAKDNLKTPHWSGLPLFIIMLFVFISFIISPYFAESGTVDLGDEGIVGGEEHEDTIEGIENPYAEMVYRFGDRFCHQKHSRSWELNGNQMPVCARDVGLFLGLALGCLMGASLGKSIHIVALLLLIAPMLIDGGLQALTGYESLNLLRVVTGILGGIGIGGYINGSIVYVVRAVLVKREKKG